MTNLQKLESSNTFTEYAEKVHEKKISRLAKQVLWPQILCGWAARLAMALACWPGESFNHTAAAQHNGSKTFMKSQFEISTFFYPTVSNHYIAICDCLSFRKCLYDYFVVSNFQMRILNFVGPIVVTSELHTGPVDRDELPIINSRPCV